MDESWIKKLSEHKLFSALRVENSSIRRVVDDHPLIFETLRAQLLLGGAILLVQILTTVGFARYSFMITLMLGVLVYTAIRVGLRQGLIMTVFVVIYNFYYISTLNGLFWLSPENLERGAIIALILPVLVIIIGRLKERNDILFANEKKARLMAQDSEKQLRFMAESMPEKIFTINPDGKTEYVNPQWQEYTGKKSIAEGDNDWATMVHPDDFAENTQRWKESLATGIPFQFEHRIKRQDGKYRWHLTRANALHDENGDIVKWIGSSTDIEDIRRTRKLEANTARLIKQRTELVALNTAKDEFISLASHQLRTPATGVKQYINMALDGYGGAPPAKLRVFLEKANESNERQLAVINDLLQVAQVDAGKVILRKEKIHIEKLIANIIHEQKSKFSRRGQSIRFIDYKGSLAVTADETKIRMVIENVIDNAGKYTPEGKNIVVRLSRVKNMANIAVIDEGVGIAEEDIDKVFQKFLRIDNPLSTEVGGTGLGLYWVQKIIDLHGGTIAVASDLGKGTTFTISLPLSSNKK